MQIKERNLNEIELARFGNAFSRSVKTSIGEGCLVWIIMFFSITLVYTILYFVFYTEYEFGLVLLVIAIGSFLFSVVRQFALGGKAIKAEKTTKVLAYKFEITDYYLENITDTPYNVIACQTACNKTVILTTKDLDCDTIYDTFEVSMLRANSKGPNYTDLIMSLNSYSTGKKVNQVELETRLFSRYDEVFYVLDVDLKSL
jgi:hypothetical protein